MKYPNSLKSNKYPSFIRNSKFLPRRNPVKLFSKIGLRNCNKTIEHNGKKYTITFSAHPWDIATMSMRGIESCQAWSGLYKYRLIGSIADPYAGIIYVHSKRSNRYGKKMAARAVVRLVKKGKRTGLLLERIYYGNKKRRLNGLRHASDDTFKIVPIIFRKFLKSTTKCEIVKKKGFQIPLSKIVNKIPKGMRSYRDSKIGYTKQVLI